MASSTIDPDLRIAAVELAVADLDRSVDFYERVLGLPVVSREGDRALLGPDGQNPSLTLSAIDRPTPLSPHASGLFHVAWLHPSRGALADTVRRVVGERWPVEGASDHGVSEALYLGDPDGLGIEIYTDRPRELWQRTPDGHGVRMVTLPLDLDDLMAHSARDDDDLSGGAAIDPRTVIGHVHMKVSDVPRAVGFYRDALGFSEQAQMPSAAFLAADGYHHHIGLNSWQSRGAGQPPDTAPALREIEFELADPGELGALARRSGTASASAGAQPDSGGERHVALADPDGVRLVFSAADAPASGASA
jgi:catechol 2,3-dioxygenase